jgi:ribA/ribD-fused uncharacterized protein
MVLFTKHQNIIFKLQNQNERDRQEIIDAPSPHEAAQRGRDRSRPLRKDWEQIKDTIMFTAIALKAQQNPHFKEKLIGTGDAEIVEDSPIDGYWGTGKDGTGKNMLGKLLMELRDTLKGDE